MHCSALSGHRKNTINSISSILDGNYILLANKTTGLFIGYKVKGPDGSLLPPRKWEKYDVESKEIPPDLVTYIKREIAPVNTGIEAKKISLSRVYTIQATATRLEITSFNAGNQVVFHDDIDGAGDNVCVDPKNQDYVFYARSQNPLTIERLDINQDVNKWESTRVSARLPQSYGIMKDLQMDPTGRFFVFMGDGAHGMVILDRATLKEVGKNADVVRVRFNDEGNLQAVTKTGGLVVYDTNLDEIDLVMKQQQIAQIVGDIFSIKKGKKTVEVKKDMRHLDSLKQQAEDSYLDRIVAASDEELPDIRRSFEQARSKLRASGIDEEGVTYVLESIREALDEKQTNLDEAKVLELIEGIRTQLEESPSLATLRTVQDEIELAKQRSSSLPSDIRLQVTEIDRGYQKMALQFYNERGAEIEEDVQHIFDRQKVLLESLDSKDAFEDWYDLTFPKIKSTLRSYQDQCPLEAVQTTKKIMETYRKMVELADEYSKKFEEQYEKIRASVADKNVQHVNMLSEEIDTFFKHLENKGIKNRADAERYFGTSAAYQEIETDIEMLRTKNADEARNLDRKVKMLRSNFIATLGRKARTQSAPDGRQMEAFGDVLFPKFEQEVKKVGRSSIETTFILDKRSQGPGMRASDLMGDIGVIITTSHGKKKTIRLWEGYSSEDLQKGGWESKGMAPSYVTQREATKIFELYRDWKRGDNSLLRKTLLQKQQALQALHAGRDNNPNYEAERKTLLDDYIKYYYDHSIAILRRIERLAELPEPEFTNGKGLIPEWSPHWVVAPEDEKMLEKMARHFLMQSELKEGILNLNGHAGTGKDVLIKMFAARANRPYFAFDCSKWTTEADLGEDITLTAENGATEAIKVPSVIVQAIRTPGALMYLNEINAMPEQAQIFLHALFDEKRSMTLKTRSGETVRARKDVLFASSMNPGYPGTFDPQMATRSRMVDLRVDYPALTREQDPGDTNPNKPYSVSEALKIARSVDSLLDMTLDADMKQNEFVLAWDYYVNGLGDDPQLSAAQKFDIEAILALCQFSNKLRESFIKKFEKTRDAKDALPVMQPITLREMRRCAWRLGKMSDEDRLKTNPEAAARQLIQEYFVSHIDKLTDRNAIEAAMTAWGSRKRIAA